MSWSLVNLPAICRPKQWPTIPKSELLSSGYPVFGANGRIGYYSEYNHEDPTILITCRGATCGSINVCEPKSYVTGNAMALDALDDSQADLQFLVHALENADFSGVITGVAQPQITRQSLARLEIPLPPLAEQKRIAGILDAADALRAKRRESLAQLDTLLQSTFLDMFGDPVTNPMGWEASTLDDLGAVQTGNTPPSKLEGMFDGEIPFVTPSDLRESWVESTRTVTDEGARKSRTVTRGATLVCCIGATIGKMGKATDFSAFNQQINAVSWGARVADDFGLELMRFFKAKITKDGTSTTLPILKKSLFQKISVPVPPRELQDRFAAIVESIEQQMVSQRAHLTELDTLFASLQQRAFRGGL